MPPTSTSILSLSPETLSRICHCLVDNKAAFNSKYLEKVHWVVPVLAVCRTLYPHAVAVLWENLDSFDPLLYTLPKSLCRVKRNKHTSSKVFVSVQRLKPPGL